MKKNSMAWHLVGGLSEPSKMPCYGWSISAFDCQVGSLLAKVKGSVCFDCYARKGRYVFPNVQKALKRRLECYNNNPQIWEDSMVELLKDEKFFRWFDSGDLQSEAMLSSIAGVAKRTPHCKHWLPTKETGIVSRWHKTHICPPNLNIRLSDSMVDAPISFKVHLFRNIPTLTFSSVVTVGVSCPSSQQGNKCLDCRDCWDRRVQVVRYKKH